MFFFVILDFVSGVRYLENALKVSSWANRHRLLATWKVSKYLIGVLFESTCVCLHYTTLPRPVPAMYVWFCWWIVVDWIQCIHRYSSFFSQLVFICFMAPLAINSWYLYHTHNFASFPARFFFLLCLFVQTLKPQTIKRILWL